MLNLAATEEKKKDLEMAGTGVVAVVADLDEMLNVINVEAQAIGKYKLLARF